MSNQTQNVVTLRLGGETMAIAAEALREILEPVPVTRVPNANPFISGLINVRGSVVPLADLRVPFGMVRSEVTEDTRMLVLDVELDRGPVTVAVLADKVHDVTRLEQTSIDEMPTVGTRWPPEFVQGIGQHDGTFIILPDLPAIFKTQSARSADTKKDLHA